MAFGLTTKFLLIVFIILTCAFFVSSLNFAEPSSNMIEDMPTCKVIVKTETIVEGKCIRLRGGRGACQTDAYLDPVNEDCT